MSNLKRFLALTLAMLMVVGAMVTVSAKSFTDVAADDAYAEAVDVLSELGVVVGATETEFNPDALVERQQMAMFIARLATAQPALFAGSAGAVFADQTAPIYNAAIQYTYSNGIIAGRTATTFDGAATVTLQEAMAMLSRALGYGNKSNNAAYPYSYMVIANEIGLLKDLEDIAPTAALTRGEVVIALYNALSAPKAERELLYTPDGQDFVVSIPDGFYGIKDDKGNVLPFDTLATKAWKFQSIASYVVATKDVGFEVAPAKTTKTLTDPVILKGYNDGKAVSFADVSKYLPEDAVANDLVGVDLTILAKGTKILKIDVLGDATETTTATYDDADGKKLVTVDGTKYDLANYFDGTYPSESDNCFYYYTGNTITKFTTADVAKLAAIKTGFFSIDILNAGKDTQKIVFKPYAFSKVEAKDGALWVSGKTVKLVDVNGAKENDYVVYFNGGDKNVSVIAVATKTDASKLVSKDTAGKVGTLESGLKVPFNQSTITGSDLPTDIALGQRYEAYVVNGVVLKLTNVDIVTTYQPKSYARILALTGDAFDGYRAKILTNSGVETIVSISKINGHAIDSYSAGSVLHVGGTGGTATDKAAKVGDTVIIDNGNIITPLYNATTGESTGTANSNFRSEDTDKFTSGATGLVATGSSIIDLNSVADVVLADFTKVVVNNNSTYTAFSGKNFKGVTSPTNFAAVYRDIAGVKELVYLYVEGTPITTSTETGTLYLFVSKGLETSTTVAYNAINLATGVAEVVTFTDANTSTIGAYKTGAEAIVYEVKPGASKPNEPGVVDTLKLYSNGYAVGANTYSIGNAKIYVWEDATYKVKALSDVAGKAYNGYVTGDLTNNIAKYVVLNAQAKITLTAATLTVTSSSAGEISAVSATGVPTGAKYMVSYKTGTAEYTTPAEFTAAITGLTAGTYKVKVYVTADGYIDSDAVEEDVVVS